MRIFVYGTLKRGYHNNIILKDAKFEGEHVVNGYMLRTCGFPVAIPKTDASIAGEIFDIEDHMDTLERLDRLEGEGFMYHRREVEPELWMYVGGEMWAKHPLEDCPSENNVYTWSRQRS